MPEDPRDALLQRSIDRAQSVLTEVTDASGVVVDECMLALDRARTDQTLASVRDTAKLLVAFRQELVDGHFPTPLADSLTRDYFDTVIGGGIDDEDDDE